MASYDDIVPQHPSFLGMIYGYTDVDKYVNWSTYIEFCHGWKTGGIYGSEYGNKVSYTSYLQYWDGSTWMNVAHHSGYFRYSVCFRWSLAGRKAGSYRIRTVYYYKGSTHINRTSAFIVER